MNQKKKNQVAYLNHKGDIVDNSNRGQGWDIYNPINCEGYDEDISNLAILHAEFPRLENKRIEFFYNNLENNLHLTINFLKLNFADYYEPL